MDKQLFGTSGIRGPAEGPQKLFTNQFCFDIGRTFAIFLKKHQAVGAVAIGGDPRDSTPQIMKFVQLGLLREGRNVLNEGVTSIPSMNNILLTDSTISGSIMVSGSHIKADLNGLKFFADKEEILKEDEAEIVEIYDSIKETAPFKDEELQVQSETRAKDLYIKRLISLGQKYPAWRAVVDPGNGAQTETMPQVLESLGLRVSKLNADLTQQFLARDTEVESDFEELKAKVKAESADFGVGYDSDGDRAVFVDENGNYIPGDYTGTLVAKYMAGSKIVTPINTSQVVDTIGKEVLRTKVGSPYVVSAMKKSDASFGFEANGGGVFSDMLSRDGGRMTIEVLNILAKKGSKLSELLSELPKFYIERDKIEYKWEFKDKIIEEAKSRFKGKKVEELDGLKIWVDENTWILFRSSANAPEFRVFAESKNKETAEKLLNDGLSLVKAVIGK
ncbi:MAG: Phosphomannomutase/phosphoglucomutase [Candidatus Woesebacteria bacterium GW2011_GWB1_40_101]|uniref:Phosphomannomutase/phosphoglucomutase n=1 Tax=Candidatus Woesebacteria bacterium GW2011_GWB1_40_101 TaxID=1618575 RepID=A0A0G0QGJ2_9BACT|nr:MAG: Phosphomannomutase/phosphoglucomutase [Candidatus Woesebacteria bacterium GW2011_GWB1_40_101]